MGQTIQAEVNDPQWAKAIKTIVPKAKDMVSKPRYWLVAYPLYITSLCVAPLEYFQQNWVPCFEAGLNKLKVGTRAPFFPFCHLSFYTAGKTRSRPGHERHDASHLDLLLPLQRIPFHRNSQTRTASTSFLPCQSPLYLSSR